MNPLGFINFTLPPEDSTSSNIIINRSGPDNLIYFEMELEKISINGSPGSSFNISHSIEQANQTYSSTSIHYNVSFNNVTEIALNQIFVNYTLNIDNLAYWNASISNYEIIDPYSYNETLINNIFTETIKNQTNFVYLDQNFASSDSCGSFMDLCGTYITLKRMIIAASDSSVLFVIVREYSRAIS